MADVRFAWPGRDPFSLAVERFEVGRGERLLLTGPSGSGKSTLLSLLCGIAVACRGRGRGPGHATSPRCPAPPATASGPTHFGVIFQMFNLLPYLSVLDNVLLPLRFSRRRGASAPAAAGSRGEARRLLARLGLEADGVAASRPPASASASSSAWPPPVR